jgi:hypothetical protein
VAGTEKTKFSGLMVSPVSAVNASYREEATALILPADSKIHSSHIYAGARDVQLTTTQAIPAD